MRWRFGGTKGKAPLKEKSNSGEVKRDKDIRLRDELAMYMSTLTGAINTNAIDGGERSAAIKLSTDLQGGELELSKQVILINTFHQKYEIKDNQLNAAYGRVCRVEGERKLVEELAVYKSTLLGFKDSLAQDTDLAMSAMTLYHTLSKEGIEPSVQVRLIKEFHDQYPQINDNQLNAVLAKVQKEANAAGVPSEGEVLKDPAKGVVPGNSMERESASAGTAQPGSEVASAAAAAAAAAGQTPRK